MIPTHLKIERKRLRKREKEILNVIPIMEWSLMEGFQSKNIPAHIKISKKL